MTPEDILTELAAWDIYRASPDVQQFIKDVLPRVQAEHARTILHFTVKGYDAGENADAKYWRARAEQAETLLRFRNIGICSVPTQEHDDGKR